MKGRNQLIKFIKKLRRDFGKILFFRRIDTKLQCLPNFIRIIVLIVFCCICFPFKSVLKKKTQDKLSSLKNDPFQFSVNKQKVRFYLPNLMYDDGTSDAIQEIIFITGNFYEYTILKHIYLFQ